MSSHRALLTDREREILAGDADVSQNYVYQIRSRVRRKLDRLERDVTILEEYQPDLFSEFLATIDR